MSVYRTYTRRGAALITAIGVLAILLAVVFTLTTLTRLELRIAANATHMARARFIAEGGASIATAILRACDPTVASLNQAWRTYLNGQSDGFDNDGDGEIDVGTTYFALDPLTDVRPLLDDGDTRTNPPLWSELTPLSGVDNDGDGMLDSAWFLVTVPVLDADGIPRDRDYAGNRTAPLYDQGGIIVEDGRLRRRC